MGTTQIKRTLLGASIALAVTQAYAIPTTRIIGGTQATPASYPWMVSLKSNGQHFCGASLIDKEWVMTAAHCVEQETASGVSVVVGEYNTEQADTGEQSRSVSKIIIHPQYGDDNDIALLKLSSPVNNNTVIRASTETMNNLAAGSLLTVMGWGNQSTTGEQFPEKLYEVQVPLVTNASCNTSYEKIGTKITENMICAGLKQGGKDSCQGDSGGPLVLQQDGKWHQVGIVSFGEGCALPDFPGVYARAEKYNTWITQQTGITVDPVDSVDPVDPELSGSDSLNLPENIEFVSLSGKKETTTVLAKNMTENLINISSINTNNSAFEISADKCTGSLAPGKSCELSIDYQPENDSEETRSELIIDLADGSSIYLDLIGLNLAAVNDQNNDLEDDFDWYAHDDWSYDDDGFNIDSSEMNTDEYSYLTAEFDGEGTFEFDFNFEDENDANYCQYFVDDEWVRTVRGSQRSVAHHSTKLSKGKHTITWKFKKRANSSGKLKINNFKLIKKTSNNAPSPAANTPAPAPTAASTPSNGGGGSGDILFLSGLALLLAGVKRRFRK